MDPTKEEDYVFNLKLAKLIGLFQIVDPNTTAVYGYNVYRVGIVVFVFYLLAVSSMFPLGLYHTANDVYTFIYYFGCVSNHFFCCYKVLNVLYHSGDIWKCMDVASFKSMSYRHYDKTIFDRRREFSASSSNAYVVVVTLPFLFWSVCPFVFRDTVLTIENAHGSYSKYRYNTLNLFFMVPDSTYNEHFYVYYLMETVIGTTFFYFSMLMDVLVVLMCVAISCKLDLVGDAIQSLWCKCSADNNNCSSR